MRLGTRFTAGVALAITALWALALAFAGSTDVALFLAPALLISLPLLAGRYVGEELIARLIARKPRPDGTSPPVFLPRMPTIWLPHGTRLLAFSLAERPPPPAF